MTFRIYIMLWYFNRALAIIARAHSSHTVYRFSQKFNQRINQWRFYIFCGSVCCIDTNMYVYHKYAYACRVEHTIHKTTTFHVVCHRRPSRQRNSHSTSIHGARTINTHAHTRNSRIAMCVIIFAMQLKYIHEYIVGRRV